MPTVASEAPNPSLAYRQPVDDLIAALETDEGRGLSDDEARSRRERYGPNELAAEKPVPAWRRFLAQFEDVLVILLLVATAISAGLWAFERDAALPYEAIAIFAVVLLNATMAVRKAGLSADALDERLPRVGEVPFSLGEGVLTPRMWRGIVFVGVIMAVGTLSVLDSSLPGGFVEGTGDLRYAQTMAFTTLMLFQIVNVFNARSDERSAFTHVFTNRWLWGAVGLSLALQVAVVYVPLLQRAFGTVGLTGRDWLFCTAVASSVMCLRELSKLRSRAHSQGLAAADSA